MQRTRIEWATHVWNPTSGCSGPNGVPCSYCYARAMARRFGRSFMPTCHPEKLDEPLRLRQPDARIFVDSNSDLLDPTIPDEFIDRVFAVIALCSVCRPRMTFIVLTKQAERMRTFVGKWRLNESEGEPEYPLPNLWLGVTMEHDGLHNRVWRLLETPAALRFVSIEPLLGRVDLERWELLCRTWRRGATIGRYLDWVIVGAQTGPGARPPQPEWVDEITRQCRAAQVPLFQKNNLSAVLGRPLIQEFPEVRP